MCIRDRPQEALAAEIGRRERQVVIRCQIEEIGQADAIAERRGVDEFRRQEAGLALHRRIRARHIGDLSLIHI